MSLTGKYRLQYPRLLTVCLLFLGAFAAWHVIYALWHAQTFRDFFPAAMVVLPTTVIYAHYRHPTRLGWFAIAALFLVPAIWATVEGLAGIYLDIGGKATWGSMIELLMICMVLLLVVAGFVHVCKVTDNAPL